MNKYNLIKKRAPKQPSTWNNIFRYLAIAAISSIGSMIPCGKLGHDPTSYYKDLIID